MTTRDAIQLDYHPPSTAIVSLAGALGRDARRALVTVLTVAGEREHIVVDLSQAESLDPSLVNAVQQTSERLLGMPARLELVIPARAHTLRSLFETVGATSIAAVHATRAQALAALGQPHGTVAGAGEQRAHRSAA
jgi:hypothetical protein